MFVSAQMIYQQPNPGVHYEFIMPSENAAQHPKENQLDGESIQQIQQRVCLSSSGTLDVHLTM